LSAREQQGGWRGVLNVSSADYYALVDMDVARRAAGLFWLLGSIIALALLPTAPPDASDAGAAGWLIGTGIGMVSMAMGIRLLRFGSGVGVGELLFHSLYAVLGVAGLMWLSDGSEPYAELLLIAVIYFAAVHPPRRVLLFLVLIGAVLASPELYDPDRSTLPDELGRFLVWGSLALVVTAFTAQVRLTRAGLIRQGDRAREEARADPLTGLGNRRAFDEAMAAAESRAERTGSPLSVVVVDIDSFKSVNDAYGLVAGDRYLRGVAEAIRETVRRPDSSFRWGGDEFVVLADVDREGGEQLAERLARAVAENCRRPDGQPALLHTGTAQLGVDGDGRESLLNAASYAMKRTDPRSVD
jgi:diguanylate cyclase (GGDEF)-like protein